MTQHTSLIAILVGGFALAFVFGALAHRLRLSPLVGYLVAGVVAGPYTPGFVDDQTLAPQLAEIGVVLLMFGVGLHFSLRDLLSVRGVALPGALLGIATTTAIGAALGHFVFGWPAGGAVVFGLCLSVASTVVLMRTLEERRLLDSSIGRLAIGWLVVEDLAMVLALVLLPALAGSLKGDADSAMQLWPALLATLFKVGAFVAFMLLVGRRVIPWLLERVAAGGSRELFTLCVLAIALGVAFGSAALFGVSFALGAFFAGMLLNESEFSHQAASETLPLRDAFAVLFFVSVGMLFDPAILLERPLQVLATAAVILLGKSLTAYTLLRALGEGSRKARMLAISLAQIGEFSFILAALGLQLELLPKDGQDLVLAGALLSILVNPLLFIALDRRTARAVARDADATPATAEGSPPELVHHVIVVGFGRVGGHLAGLLQGSGVTLVVIEDDADLVAAARGRGILAILGNVADPVVLAEAAPERAKLAVFAIPQALEAAASIARLKAINPGITVLARAHTDGQVRHLLEHGADAAVLAERELAQSLAEMVMATPQYRGSRSLPPANA
ncbi:MAG TPA: YbaL family putative K(+) efflux transporter [Xanthomonadaceae bacterium]|nr:YbaL family putative K(+) efflux transporter [Xanthomonadaceae bacterium]